MRRALPAGAALALVAACGGGSSPRVVTEDLAPLRAAAALAPCPTGVGRLPHLVLPCLGGGPDVTLDSPPQRRLAHLHGFRETGRDAAAVLYVRAS